MQYTKKEYDILLCLRRKSRTAEYLHGRFKPNNEGQWNVWLSDLSKLYYVEPETAKPLAQEGTLTLNDIGETVAQAEFDRRFDMYFTRIMSFLALAVSIIALIIEAIFL